MRVQVSLLFLMMVATTAQAEPAPLQRPRSAESLLRLHPSAWRAPMRVAATAPAMRFEPDDGTPVEPLPAVSNAGPRLTHPLADIPVQTRADGSRFAYLGGRLRSFTVVSIDGEGRLQQDCVHSEQAADAWVKATSKTGRK